MTDLAFLIACIFLLSLACQWIAWRIQQPAILLLLSSGLVIGPLTGWLQPDELLGDLLFPFVSLAVAVILFDGALTLRMEEMRENGRVVRRLVTSGILINWILIALAAWLLLDVPVSVAALLGALSVVTGPTVIMPMLRSVHPTRQVASILRWESILIDPIGALLAVLVYEYVLAWDTGMEWTHSLWIFGQTLALGLATGALGGYLVGVILRRHWLPDYLYNFGVLVMVLAIYAASNHWVHESGLVTVTVMGLVLANMDGVDTESILEFKETLSVLLISILFILLAARLELPAFIGLDWTAWVFLAAVLWVARPVSVWFSALNSGLRWQEKVMLSWIAPRGIVAAAISALFAIKMEALGIAGAELIVPLVFVLIIGSVLIQSLTARPLAQWLKATAPPPTGFLIIGANAFARALAAALIRHKVRVLLVDTSWDAVQDARMESMETYYGNPLSEHADQHLDLTGIACLLSVSPYRQINSLAGYHYLNLFGRGNALMLHEPSDRNRGDNAQLWSKLPQLFDGKSTYSRLASIMARGGQVKETGLTEAFSWDDYLAHQPDNIVPLFAVDPKGRIRIFHDRAKFQPEQGWRVISLIPPEKKPANGQQTAADEHDDDSEDEDDEG